MSTSYTEREQQAFLDELAVNQTLNRYWFGLGNRDVDTVMSTFAPEARCGRANGTAEIRAMQSQIEDTRAISMIRGSQRIEVDGDTARADTQAVGFIVRTGVVRIGCCCRACGTSIGWPVSRQAG